jgi:PAS domain-containing protein
MANVPVDPDKPDEQPLELILARNLVSIIAVAALIVDTEGRIVFFNEAAAEIIGRRYEETGALTRDQWNVEFGPLDDDGKHVPFDELPLTIALREGRPAYGRFRISADPGLIEIEVNALPLIGPAGNHGALVVFWPIAEDARE